MKTENTTGGYYAVDLDATLAEYHGWADGAIGKPVPAMVDRVKAWRSRGAEVRIITARMSGDNPTAARRDIEEWCLRHLGEVLPVQNTVDFRMIEFWNDRAVGVIANTGISHKELVEWSVAIRELEKALAREEALHKELVEMRRLILLNQRKDPVHAGQ